MAETQKGVAVVWGISATGYTWSGYSGTLRTQTQGYSLEADQDETRDEAGEVIGVTHYNQRQTISLSVVPSGATLSAARSSNVLPTPGTEIKVIDATDTEIGASTPGKSYMVVSATKNRSNNGKVTFEITAIRYAGISTYTPVT